MKHILIKKAKDNVGNAIEYIAKGELFQWEIAQKYYELIAITDVPFAFKVAVKDITKGEVVICYGEPIGLASADIAAGECVHVHNLQGKRGNS